MGELVTRDDAGNAAGERMLALIRTRFPAYHPILAIAELAHSKEAVDEDPRLALDCHKTILRYVTPELKSIEIKADITEHRRVIVSMFDGEELLATPFTESNPTVLAAPGRSDPMWELLGQLQEAA